MSADARIGAPAAIGDHVAHYRIEEELGRGAAAVVFRAQDVRLSRTVALKALRAGQGTDRDEAGDRALRRALREVRLLSRLMHPHIVALLGGFAHDGRPWLVMEYVDGPALPELLESRGQLPARDVLRIGADLAGALEFAHARGVLHQDVTPGNILVAKDGCAKLTDFGLARITAAPRDLPGAVEHPGLLPSMVVGTRGYLAPEQAQGLAVDARADVFSLGAVLYEMLTGRPAFPVTDPLAPGGPLASAIVPPRAVNPALPAEIERIVLTALAPDRAERYRSAGELERSLRGLLGG